VVIKFLEIIFDQAPGNTRVLRSFQSEYNAAPRQSLSYPTHYVNDRPHDHFQVQFVETQGSFSIDQSAISCTLHSEQHLTIAEEDPQYLVQPPTCDEWLYKQNRTQTLLVFTYTEQRASHIAVCTSPTAALYIPSRYTHPEQY
jgi:hypothetical protein